MSNPVPPNFSPPSVASESAVAQGSASREARDLAGPLRVAIVGAEGRMGREAVAAVNAQEDLTLCARILRGDPLRTILLREKPAVMVDFTLPHTVKAHALTALELDIHPVLGATGLSPEDLAEMTAFAQARGLGGVYAPNFSLAAVLMIRFAAEAASRFSQAEIIELHHPGKRDSPSGTAIKTAREIALAWAEKAAGIPEKASAETAKKAPDPFPASPEEPARGLRVEGVPVHAVRLPGHVAHQEIIFGGPGESLRLRHDTLDRSCFMPGVLLAIRRVSSLKSLVYGLEHLL